MTGPRRLAEQLQQITEALAATGHQPAVFAAVLRPALAALGADAGTALLVDGAQLAVAATQGQAAGPSLWPGGPLAARWTPGPRPPTRCARTRHCTSGRAP